LVPGVYHLREREQALKGETNFVVVSGPIAPSPNPATCFKASALLSLPSSYVCAVFTEFHWGFGNYEVKVVMAAQVSKRRAQKKKGQDEGIETMGGKHPEKKRVRFVDLLPSPTPPTVQDVTEAKGAENTVARRTGSSFKRYDATEWVSREKLKISLCPSHL